MGDPRLDGRATDEDVRRIQLELGRADLARPAARSGRPRRSSTRSCSRSGYAILFHLVQEGPTLARGLVETFGLDKAAVSRQVAQLEQLGLITRTPHPDDGRAQLLTATDEGRGSLPSRHRPPRRHPALAPERLVGRDLRALGALLGRLNGCVTRP